MRFQLRILHFDPVHQRIAVPGPGQVVSVRDFQTGRELLAHQGYQHDLQSLAFSPDGNWLACGDGLDPLPDRTPPGRLKLWNLQTGEVLELKGHRHDGIYDLAFSPDGKTLVSVGGGAMLWEVPTGKLLARLEGHQQPIFAVSYAPDG